MTDDELCGYVRQYHGMLVRLAFSYMKNREDAEDVAQDAFIRLYRCNKAFAADDNVKAWLIRVTVNLCKDMLRSSAYKHRGEQLDDIPCESTEELGLLDCVKRMKPEYAGAVYLYYYEGYSVKELAGGQLAAEFIRKSGEKLHADIVGLNRRILMEVGVKGRNIDLCRICTCCHPELFYSHRYSNGVSGTMLSVISM